MLPLPRRRGARGAGHAREYQASSPDDEELTTPYIEGANLDVSAWARDAVALASAGEDPLPPRLRRPVRRVRQEPERRAAHARGAARRPPLGRARSATRPGLSGRLAHSVGAAFHQDDVAPRRRASSRSARGPRRCGSRSVRGARSTRRCRPGSRPGSSNADRVGAPDELLEQRGPDAAAARGPADVDRVLDDAAVAGDGPRRARAPPSRARRPRGRRAAAPRGAPRPRPPRSGRPPRTCPGRGPLRRSGRTTVQSSGRISSIVTARSYESRGAARGSDGRG